MLYIKIIFKVHLSKIGIDVSQTFCWKHEWLLFQQLKKERYNSHYMSASQYDSGENTEMYVHIFASGIQLMYIF